MDSYLKYHETGVEKRTQRKLKVFAEHRFAVQCINEICTIRLGFDPLCNLMYLNLMFKNCKKLVVW